MVHSRQASRGRSNDGLPPTRAQEAKLGGRPPLSGISGSGRHVASHAKPGKMNSAKGKVKTAAAVTSVLAVSGGVAAGLHMHQDSLRNSTEAAAQDGNAAGAAAAAGALAARNAHATDVNRDAQRPDLAGSSSSAPGASTDSSSTTTPLPSTPTPTSDSSSPLPGASGSPISRSSSSTSSSSAPTTSRTSTTSKPTTTTSPSAPSTSSSSSVGLGIDATPAQAQAIAKQLVPSGQYACFANIISRESSWDVHATNPYSGAYGLGQALPGDKMAGYGSEWRNSATIQIKWALAYMTGRYGSPCAAWTFWQNHSWY